LIAAAADDWPESPEKIAALLGDKVSDLAGGGELGMLVKAAVGRVGGNLGQVRLTDVIDLVVEKGLGFVQKEATAALAKKLPALAAVGADATGASALAEAVKDIYQTARFVLMNLQKLDELVVAVSKGTRDVVNDNPGALAGHVTEGLDLALELGLGYLLDQLGLEDAPRQAAEVLKGIQGQVRDLLTDVAQWFTAVGGQVLGLGPLEALTGRDRLTPKASGTSGNRTAEVWLEKQGDAAVVVAALSDPAPLKPKLEAWAQRDGLSAELMGKIQEALNLLTAAERAGTDLVSLVGVGGDEGGAPLNEEAIERAVDTALMKLRELAKKTAEIAAGADCITAPAKSWPKCNKIPSSGHQRDYQLSACGNVEYEISGNNEKKCADAVEGTVVVDCKSLTNPRSSPQLGTAPQFIAIPIIAGWARELLEYQKIISDPCSGLTKLVIRVEDQRQVSFWKMMLQPLTIVTAVELVP
jgi:hypothetical protein